MYSQFKDHITKSSAPSSPVPTKPAPPQPAKKQALPQRTKTIVEKRDLMISYSHANRTFMRRMKDYLNKAALTVWVDEVGLKAGVDFLGKIGEAIIMSKCFLTILSSESVKSKYCQDELALAYISNKPIFPVALEPASQLYQIMDTGMKLQLARFQWFAFENEDEFGNNADALVQAMKNSITEQDLAAEKKAAGGAVEGGKGGRKKFRRQQSSTGRIQQEGSHNVGGEEETEGRTKAEPAQDNFWVRCIGEDDSVTWESFKESFLKEYGTELTEYFPDEDRPWLLDIILKRELEVKINNGHVTKEAFISFCTVDDEFFPFWQRIQDQAVESYTMKEVFSMDSTVRLDAIENLGKFRSAAVIEALIDLLTDLDNNVRSVAAISLARTGEDSERVINSIILSLDDRDRLVRESGCLALGHLKAKKAVKKILHLWRNDFISHVREAAQVALEQIGGEEAEKAIHVTKVLSEEIRNLTSE